MAMRLLFVAGPARSGTTAFTEYLNQHPEILVCMERYMFVADKITPDFFSFERILDYEPRQGESNYPWEYHAELLARKDPEKLKWIGDKTPGFHRSFPTLLRNNPGARFIVTYRPIEEVAESFDARSKNPDDPWLGGKNGVELGVKFWNRTMQNTSNFMKSELNPDVLIIDYHDFFYRNEECVPLISRFLDLEFDEAVREAWRETSRKFESKRRRKEPLSAEQVAYIEANKNHRAEERVLRRIEEQWREIGISRSIVPRVSGERNGAGGRGDEKDGAVEELGRRIEILKTETNNLERRNRNLEHQIREIQASRSWRLLVGLGRARAKVLGRGGR